MKKIIIYFPILLIFVLSGCSQSFLDTKDLSQKTTANFYQTPSDAAQALTGIYSSYVSAMDPNNGGSIFLLSEQMSDECFSGGGQHDNQGAMDQWQESKTDQYAGTWKYYYQGIFRANTLIKYIDQVKGWSKDDRAQTLGEARFMRAMNYFDLMRLFGGPVSGKMMGVPLITDPDYPSAKRASVDSVYAQIASDLKFAIDSMPAVAYKSLEPGHATKWAAEALMARVFLFYNGQAYGRTYNSSSATMPLADGSQVTNAQVVGWVDDCISSSGYSVEPTFGNLWPYSYKSDNNNYPYAVDNGLDWVGDDGAGGDNPEAVFQIVYSTFGGWNDNQSTSYANMINLFQGWRLQGTLPFGYGWGWCTVSPTVFNTNSWFANGDKRKVGSVCDVSDPNEGVTPSYTWGGDLWEETGYWQKKYVPINVEAPASAGATGNMWNYSHELFPDLTYNTQTDNTQNLILIRFSDVLLMGAELGSSNALSYLNQVHAHSGLADLTEVTLANIQKERKAELAFEGIRYWDELRWGTVESDLNAESGVTIWNAAVQTTYTPNVARFKATKGFLPIPETQITLSDNELKQNDGWTAADGDRVYQGN
ncbi:RagB/SusD family nutrient uptake outer membrane protein [Prolixibacter denitrificans]|uniref:Starch-binding protein n=1 Tax=Prolixibacter denitrificans TaxID=1541063 RepID=A0A2P8C6W3_9BACT|nr:RagB/SusD family nutrient uptake outer membrane protein [Prolixibacter denitrificans]PSK80657.1 SusD-like starch-binding protein associating with outer membrane [Prolixibacter denitrificans]GET22048.1 starch-binding protein [Prolixibacter denitrificans]